MAYFVRRMRGTAICTYCSQKIFEHESSLRTKFKKQNRFIHLACHASKKAAEEEKKMKGPITEETVKYNAAIDAMNK